MRGRRDPEVGGPAWDGVDGLGVWRGWVHVERSIGGRRGWLADRRSIDLFGVVLERPIKQRPAQFELLPAAGRRTSAIMHSPMHSVDSRPIYNHSMNPKRTPGISASRRRMWRGRSMLGRLLLLLLAAQAAAQRTVQVREG